MSTLRGLAALLLCLSGLLGETPAEVNSARGQTLYVPVYSEIPYGDRDRTLELTATLSIRNIDRKVAVLVWKVDYFNAKGELVRSYAQEPRALPPLAAVEFVIKASDRSGGISAGFVVEWESEHLCVPPVVEAVMISTASTQGISFSSQARIVVSILARPRGRALPLAVGVKALVNVFQSSPAPEDGRCSLTATRPEPLTQFQSSPAPEDGRCVARQGRQATAAGVSILAPAPEDGRCNVMPPNKD